MSPHKKVFAPAPALNNGPFDRTLQRVAMFPGYTLLASPTPSRQPLRRRATIDTVGRSASSSSIGSRVTNPKIAHVNDTLAKSKSDVDILACHLAAKYHLTLQEVKTIKNHFKQENLEAGARQGLNKAELHSVLCHLFSVPKVDDAVLHGAYEASKTDQGAVLEKFLQWYIQHMFCEINDLNAEVKKNVSEKIVTRLSEQYNTSPLVIDKIKKQFDHFDVDGNGVIDFKEFQNMFPIIVKAKTTWDLNPKQILHFWREMDKDGSGGIDFGEFTDWYLKCFEPSSDEDVFNTVGLSPMEHFYDTFNPTKQRKNSLHLRRFTLE